MDINVCYDHTDDIQMHLWCNMPPIIEKEARDPTTYALYRPPTMETGHSNESLCTAPGRSESLVRCPTYLEHLAIALVAGGSPHHVQCCVYLHQQSEQLRIVWCE